MAFTYGFYNSMNGDRKYNAEQISAIFDGLIEDGVFHSQGEIFGTIPGDGMQVVVKSGRAWFNHTWSFNDSGYPINIAPADVSLPRIDAIVLEVDFDTGVRRNRLIALTGSPATTPVKPAMGNTATRKRYPLAYVTVRAATGSILGSDIQITVGTSECPFVTGILASVNIDILFAQWEDEFEQWWANIKATLNDNVVTNLQNQINDRVKCIDLASKAEAEAGTNNTKWMSPLRVKEAVGDAGGTVLDVATGEKVNLESILDTVGISPISGYLPSGAVFPTNTGASAICFNSVKNKLFVLYLVDSGTTNYKNAYIGSIDTVTVGQKAFTQVTQIGTSHYYDSGDYYIRNTFYFYPQLDAQNDGAVICIYTGGTSSGSYWLFDTNSNALSPAIGGNYFYGFFATASYWGYYYQQDQNTRRFYYATRTNGTAFSNVNIGAGQSSSYFSLTLIGAYNNDVYFLEMMSASQYQLGRTTLSASPTTTRGLATYDVSSKSWSRNSINFSPIFHDARYAYVCVYVYNLASPQNFATCPTALKIDMTDGTSNWGSLPTPSTELYAAPFNVNGTGSYIGTIGNFGYMINNYKTLVAINKTTGAYTWTLMLKNLTSSNTYFHKSKREQIFSILGLSNYIPSGSWLIDTVNAEANLLAGYTDFYSGSYINDPYLAYIGTLYGNNKRTQYIPIMMGITFTQKNILGGLSNSTVNISGTSRVLIQLAGGKYTYRAQIIK